VDTPFLEFSLLKNATYPELSKYELAAVLGSLKGRKE